MTSTSSRWPTPTRRVPGWPSPVFRWLPTVACLFTTVPGGTIVNGWVETPTTTGFYFYIYRTNTTGTWISYFAVSEM